MITLDFSEKISKEYFSFCFKNKDYRFLESLKITT